MPEAVSQAGPSGIGGVFDAVRLPVGDPFALTGLVIYALFIATALCAPLIAPFDPIEILYTEDFDLASDLLPGDQGHLLGTTSLGRDIFSQIVWGARSALLVGLTAAFMVAFIGSIVGLLAGYFGGWVDALLMRLADVAFGIPFLPFVIVISAFSEPSIWNTVTAMALVLWRDTGRVIRSQVLSLRSRGYVEAARVTGFLRPQDHPAPHHAEHPAPELPLRLHRHRLGDPHRSLDQLSGLRRPGCDQLGVHAAGCVCQPGVGAPSLSLVRPAGPCNHPRGRRRLLHFPRI